MFSILSDCGLILYCFQTLTWEHFIGLKFLWLSVVCLPSTNRTMAFKCIISYLNTSINVNISKEDHSFSTTYAILRNMWWCIITLFSE